MLLVIWFCKPVGIIVSNTYSSTTLNKRVGIAPLQHTGAIIIVVTEKLAHDHRYHSRSLLRYLLRLHYVLHRYRFLRFHCLTANPVSKEILGKSYKLRVKAFIAAVSHTISMCSLFSSTTSIFTDSSPSVLIFSNSSSLAFFITGRKDSTCLSTSIDVRSKPHQCQPNHAKLRT